MSELPAFLCIGAAKSGTTSLHEALSSHPQIFLPRRKELNFFSHDLEFARGVDHYRRYFANSGGQVAGDITPQYMFSTKAPGRARSVLGGQIAVIALLRSPIERAYSHYLHVKARGFEPLSFIDALAEEPHRLQAGVEAGMRYGYIARSRYAEQIERWLEAFGSTNFRAYVFETDWVDRQAHTLDDISTLVGVDPVPDSAERVANRGYQPRWPTVNRTLYSRFARLGPVYRRLVPDQDRRRLLLDRVARFGSRPVEALQPELRSELQHEHFADEIDRLEALLQKDLEHWRSSRSGSRST